MLEFEINKILNIFKKEKYTKEQKKLFLEGKKIAANNNEIIIEACDIILKKLEEETNN